MLLIGGRIMRVHERKKKWNRRLINFLWMALIFNIIVTMINIRLNDIDFAHTLILQVGIPITVFLICILLFEWNLKQKDVINDYLLIVGMMIIIASFMFFYDSVMSVIIILFVFPIFFAVFTMKKRLIFFAFAADMITFWGLNLLCPHFDYLLLDQITFTFLLIVAYFLGIMLTNHYQELNNELLEAVKNEKELLYKKVFMEKLAKIDLATNLYNHKTLHEYLEKIMEQFSRRPFPLHVALLDLDDFKKVNDTYGHSVGDLVIETTAQIILEYISDHDFASRYGGEEFAIVFLEKTQEECLDILEKIRASLEAQKFDEMNNEVMTLSIGLATEAGALDKDRLFNKADEYLYHSKRKGKNQITYGISCLNAE